MEYSKPHRDYNEQVELLIERGLDIPNRADAVAALKRIGYYRLSAYTYPLRVPGVEPGSRGTNFIDGASLLDALALYNFDERLRAELLSGLQRLEVVLRVQIGYHLGKRDMFGHLDRNQLDAVRCSQIPPNDVDDAHDRWLDTYENLQAESKHEDYVKHFILNYDGRLPIWVATELMTFGCLTRLYSLLGDTEANRIAKNLGVPTGRDVLEGWLRSLNTLRNHCAHNARIWNRATIYPPKRLPSAAAPEPVKHLAHADNNRIYYLAALCAHLLVSIDARSAWPRQFLTTVRKYKPVHGMTVENTMGFPAGWEELELWALRQ